MKAIIKPLLGATLCLAVSAIAQTAPPSAPYAVGDVVEIEVGGTWFKGKILKILPNAVYTVRIDALGERSDTSVPATRIRRPGTSTTPGAPAIPTPTATFQAGDHIDIQLGEKWLPGRVLRIMPDGTYFVRFDALSESEDTFVPAARVRKPTASTDPAAAPSKATPKPSAAPPQPPPTSRPRFMIENARVRVENQRHEYHDYTILKMGRYHCYLTRDDGPFNNDDGWFPIEDIEPRKPPYPPAEKRPAMWKPNINKLPPEPPKPPDPVKPLDEKGQEIPWANSMESKTVDLAQASAKYTPDARPPSTPATNSIEVRPPEEGFAFSKFSLAPAPGLKAFAIQDKSGYFPHVSQVDLAQGKVTLTSTIPGPRRVLAISPDGAKAFCSESGDKAKQLSIFVYDITKPEATEVSRFQPYTRRMDQSSAQIRSAVSPSPARLITLSQSGRLTAWDISSSTPKAIWRAERGDHTDTEMQLSANGKYLAISTDKAAIIIETETGNTASIIDDLSRCRLAFSDDGSRLAATRGESLRVLSLPAKELLCDTFCPFRESSVGFVSNDLFFTGEFLVDVKLGVPVWKYSGATDPCLLNGRVFYRSGNRIRSVQMGGPEVAAVQALLADAKDLFAFEPGDTVGLDVSVGDGAEGAVIESLKKTLLAASVITGDNPRLRLVARAEAGETKTIAYSPRHGPYANHVFENVNVVERKWRLALEFDGKPIWERQGVDGAPESLDLKEGESIEQAIVRTRIPVQNHFTGHVLPPRIPSAKYLTPKGWTPLPG